MQPADYLNEFLELNIHSGFDVKSWNKFFKYAIRKEIRNHQFPNFLNCMELIGNFVTSIAQYELKIFNYFIIHNQNIIQKSHGRKENITDISDDKLKEVDGKILNKNGDVFDPYVFLHSLYGKVPTKKKIETTIRLLMTGKWNYFFVDVLEKLISSDGLDLEWFKNIREYRHILVHSVEAAEHVPYGDESIKKNNNWFNSTKTIFNAELILSWAYMIDAFDFKKNQVITGIAPYNYFAQYLLMNAPLFGSLIIISEFAKQDNNVVAVSEIFDFVTKNAGKNFKEGAKIIYSDGSTVEWRIAEPIFTRIRNTVLACIKAVTPAALHDMGIPINCFISEMRDGFPTPYREISFEKLQIFLESSNRKL